MTHLRKVLEFWQQPCSSVGNDNAHLGKAAEVAIYINNTRRKLSGIHQQNEPSP